MAAMGEAAPERVGVKQLSVGRARLDWPAGRGVRAPGRGREGLLLGRWRAGTLEHWRGCAWGEGFAAWCCFGAALVLSMRGGRRKATNCCEGRDYEVVRQANSARGVRTLGWLAVLRAWPGGLGNW